MPSLSWNDAPPLSELARQEEPPKAKWHRWYCGVCQRQTATSTDGETLICGDCLNPLEVGLRL